jgi:hypothetical protein
VRDEFERFYATDGEVHPSSGETSELANAMVGNIFDSLAALLAPTQEELRNDLDRYLAADVEDVRDPLGWWNGKKATYPKLSRMALDYLVSLVSGFPPDDNQT